MGFEPTLRSLVQHSNHLGQTNSSEAQNLINNLVFAKLIWAIMQIWQILLKCLVFYTKHLKLSSKCSQCKFK